jgi:CrcB protein
MTWWQWGIVSVSAVAGAMIRLGITRSFVGVVSSFPMGTVVVNMVGCFAIGVLWAVLEKVSAQEWVRLAVITGALGSLTTFSTFALDALKLLQAGQIMSALTYVLSSVVIGIGLVAIGAYIATFIVQ